MKNIVYLGLIPLLCMLCSCDAAKSFNWEKEENYIVEIHGLDKDVMPIVGYSGPTYSGPGASWDNPVTLTDEQVKQNWIDAKEAGFNTMYSLYWAERISYYPEEDEELYNTHHECIMKNLSFADEVGLKFVLMDYLYQEAAKAGTKEAKDKYIEYLNSTGYLDHESFLGFIGADEPTYDNFDVVKVSQAFMDEILPGYLFQTNLLPCHASGPALHYETYDKYVSDFIEQINPHYVSYDYYAPIGEYPEMRGLYFYQLGIMKEICKKYKLPFWNFALTSVHYDYRLITPAELYWQINTSLAYGIKGIQYFNFKTPNDVDYIGKGGSIIDENGNKTVLFEPAKTINNYIATIDEYLMNASHQLTIARGNTPAMFYYDEDLNTDFRELGSVNVSNGGVVVGCFDYNGKTILYLASNDIENDTEVYLNFKAKINAECIGMRESKTYTKANRMYQLLKPGESMLIKIL